MRIARVIGSAVSTVKAESLLGSPLLVLCETTTHNEPVGEPFVAVDAVGAGYGELVLVSEGSAGRHTPLTVDTPADAVIMAILDSLEVDGATTFQKS